MPRATRQESEATARRLVLAAHAGFAEDGYAAVRLEDVAARAGVTRGALYNHFGSKRGLFEAVLGDVQRSVAADVEQAAGAASAPWESLEAGCLAFLTSSMDPRARRIMLIDGPAVLGWSAWRALDQQTSGRLLTEALTLLAADGEFPVDAAAALLSGAMNEAALWIASTEDPATAADDAWRLLRGLIASLRA